MVLTNKLKLRIGKATKQLMRLRGGGSALPGLVIEKLQPDFLKNALSDLPHGVVVVSGTNGKTTTTKMLAQLLTSQGLTVFTNPTGSNFTRGIAAAALDEIDPDTGKLTVDIAVLELDEAHALHFIKQITPRYSLILNVLRDQLDRFGEINHTRHLLAKVVAATESGVVLNREDPLIASLTDNVDKSTKLAYFGLSEQLLEHFPSDDDMRGATTKQAVKPVLRSSDTILTNLDKARAEFAFGKKAQEPVIMQLDGIYNVFNAAAALSTARMIMGADVKQDLLMQELAQVKPAFGRGETIELENGKLDIVLVKNPSGFRLGLKSYQDSPAETMIAINDNYADGRDMSWLWDVDFAQFADKEKVGVKMVSGTRAYDMALRLQYDDVLVGQVETNLATALDQFLANTTGHRRIYTTYTAMLRLRRLLAKSHKLESML